VIIYAYTINEGERVMKIYKKITELIGNTPLIQLENIQNDNNSLANIFAKLEYFNPAGSIKDRTAFSMLEDARERGLLKEGSVIIEPTSGNTGIGLCMAAATFGYKVILTMPESMSLERRNLLKAFGASLVLTPASEGMTGAIQKANEIALETPNSFIPSQFENLANPKVHFETTGPEIWNDTDGKVDILVCGVGTGGTLTGTGEFLKSKNNDIKVVAVEPEKSPVLSKGVSGSHGLQGIGANFVPSILNRDIIDEIITVSEENAYKFGNAVAKREGFLIGISSGAALCAAVNLSKREENKGKNIVVIFPDTGERYLSTPLFE
jgi:cysteine synthase A